MYRAFASLPLISHRGEAPACCFSLTCAFPNAVLKSDVIQEYSNWPTIPQLYIDGEFTGGADIMIESFQSGELKKTLEDAGCKFVSEG